MQTPAGFEIVDGRFVPDRLDRRSIFNPSFPYRLAHTVVAVYLTTAFTVIGVAAWYLRRGRYAEESRVMITMGVLLATVLLPLQLVIGDLHGVNTLEHQPQKLAAMEGIWEGGPGQPAILFAIPDEAAEKNHAEIASRSSPACTSRIRLGRPRQGPEGFPEGRAAAGRAAVLRVPR